MRFPGAQCVGLMQGVCWDSSLLGFAFIILNTWVALSASFSLALPWGGPSVILWGLLVAGIGNGCLAASMAEFASAYPT